MQARQPWRVGARRVDGIEGAWDGEAREGGNEREKDREIER